MEPPRLTWHRDSVLPYASLSHTLHRACELNGLWPHQLARMAAIRDHDGRHRPAYGIDRARLAALLGEPSEKFRWSTLDEAPACLRPALFGAHARVCPLCLAAGYHSDLFALRWLKDCPIHAVPLRAECHCGRALPMTLSDPDGPPGSCPCDRLRFFTPELCRRPRLVPADMLAMDALVAWLDALTQLAHSEAVAGQRYWTQRLEPEEIMALSEAMGQALPPGLLSLPSRDTLRLVRRPDTGSRRNCCCRRPPPDLGLTAQASSYWPDAPALMVYRAMARHFRRHVVPRTATWLARIFRYPHAAVAAATAAHHPQATLVLTECLWARSVEPNVDLRRWPYRAPPAGVFGDLSEQVMLHASIHTPNRAFSGTPDRTWLAYHAAASPLLQLWTLAERRVRATLEGGRLHCPDAGEIATGPLRPWWSARRAHATCLVETVIAGGEAWGPIFRPGKAARCYRAMRHRHRRRRAIVAQWQAQGSGLTYSAESGWTVAAALAPANADIRRRRLLGEPESGVRFWIYREGGGAFVARLCDGRIQAVGESPRAAIMGLRSALLRYRPI
ncbi:hypothetical protein LMG23992_04156 [Cupriavidus laharis]|uniref:TniQ family protein n=1 Tax=Cupriavidus laharis TaxID=151654 RepID=A0ABN7Z2P5_9BURK|nr:TniQ family protein [Cupriavidus laharis]CAG9180167.1 hypothetical protein LMG23992_04156 [Cupriavidus laharis]